MALVIYSLCTLTCVACAVLLFRAYGQSRVKLLFWSGMCFVGLTASNVALIVDRVVYPDVDLYGVRLATALAGLLLLIYGLIWEGD